MQVNPPPPPPPYTPPAAGPIWSPVGQSTGIIPPAARRRRRGWIVWGIVLAVLGLLITIGGAIAMVVSRTASSLDPVAEGRTPGTATFMAEKETYDVLLVTGRASSARTSESLRCLVTLADGRTINLDGSKQDVSTEVANTESIGSFDAVPGQTSVFCDADGGDNRFVIDVESLLSKVALSVVFGGVFVLLLATGLILGGVFWKKPAA